MLPTPFLKVAKKHQSPPAPTPLRGEEGASLPFSGVQIESITHSECCARLCNCRRASRRIDEARFLKGRVRYGESMTFSS